MTGRARLTDTEESQISVGSFLCHTFDQLKRALTSSPIQAYPDFHIPFDLYVDASQDGLGMVLGQTQDGNEVVITYSG